MLTLFEGALSHVDSQGWTSQGWMDSCEEDAEVEAQYKDWIWNLVPFKKKVLKVLAHELFLFLFFF